MSNARTLANLVPDGLDDYEEGTWTATFTGTTHTATGYYTKIGRTVYAYVYSSAMTVTSSVNAIIGGLPFTINVSYAAGIITHNNYATNSENGYVQSGETNFYITSNNSPSTNNTAVGSSKYIMMAVFYFTNA